MNGYNPAVNSKSLVRIIPAPKDGKPFWVPLEEGQNVSDIIRGLPVKGDYEWTSHKDENQDHYTISHTPKVIWGI